MTPLVKKVMYGIAAIVIAGAPAAFPALDPFRDLFIALGSALGGGAFIPRPGDVRK